MHVHRMSLVVAAMAVAAACGGGGDASDPSAAPAQTTSTASATTPAPPRDYSIDELTAALPTKDDVPDAVARNGSCPEDGAKICGEPGESPQRVGVSFDLAVASGAGSAGDAEQRAAQATVEDGIYVSVSRYGTAAAAADSTASARADAEQEFDGPIDSGDEQTSFGLPESGTGSVVDADVEGWIGHLSSRATTVTNGGETQQIQNAQLLVVSGAVTVSANVVVDATGREADYAADLARKAVADYVARLG